MDGDEILAADEHVHLAQQAATPDLVGGCAIEHEKHVVAEVV
jgi:hypothetical protein